MPLHDKSIEYLRKRRFESLLCSILLALMIGYVFMIRFRDHVTVPELPFLCLAGLAALLSSAFMARAYHRELRRRKL